MRWLSRGWGYLMLAIAVAIGVWGQMQRGKAVRLNDKAREGKREKLDAAEFHSAKAATAAARANEALARQNLTLKNLEKRGDQDIADRARAINDRMRSASRPR